MVLKHEKKKVVPIPQFCLRITPKRIDQFERVKSLIDDIHLMLKKAQAEDEKVINKSEIIIEALEIGLKVLKSNFRK